MARITKHGCRSDAPSDNLPWWDGAEVQCAYCACHFEFVCGEDFERVIVYVHPFGPVAQLPCPECGEPVTATPAHVEDARAKKQPDKTIVSEIGTIARAKEAPADTPLIGRKKSERRANAVEFTPVKEKLLRARLLGGDTKQITVDSVESAEPLPLIEQMEAARVNAIREINTAHNARVREILEERDKGIYGSATDGPDS